jgi:hypothetical protein
MATWSDVTKIMKSIEGAELASPRRWNVKKKLAVWERPLRKSDIEALGDAAPAGDILGVYVPLEIKEALLKAKRSPYFTTPHFDGYPYLLVRLKKARVPALRKLLVSSCLERGRKGS